MDVSIYREIFGRVYRNLIRPAFHSAHKERLYDSVETAYRQVGRFACLSVFSPQVAIRAGCFEMDRLFPRQILELRFRAKAIIRASAFRMELKTLGQTGINES